MKHLEEESKSFQVKQLMSSIQDRILSEFPNMSPTQWYSCIFNLQLTYSFLLFISMNS